MNSSLKKFKIWPKIFKFYLLVVLLSFTFLGGFLVGALKVNPLSFLQDGFVFNKTLPGLVGQGVDFKIFWQEWEIIQNKYLKRPVDEKNLLYGSMAGLAASVQDPYTVFFDPNTTKAFNQEMSGSFEGIGIEIGIKQERLVVIAPLPGSPAEKAGIKAGDKILKINEIETTDLGLDTAVSLIRGEKGTTVNLLIERATEPNPLSFSVKREVINVSSIEWRLTADQFAYLKITEFNGDTDKSFQKAVREIILQEPKGIILDLRNNPGGFLDAAIKIASNFVPKGEIVVIEDFGHGVKKEYRSEDKTALTHYPLVVLVNSGSASASEIVTGALKDYAIATIVGEKTFGKGSVQELEQFSDGSSLKITVAEWLTPKGHSINAAGIEPDVIVELTKSDYENNLDPQLDKAIDILKEKTK